MTQDSSVQLSASAATAAPVRAMRISLIVIWLGTALVSAIDFMAAPPVSNVGGVGAQLLADAGITNPSWQSLLIWGGLLADLLVGLALWLKPGRNSYWMALGLMSAMTVVGSAIQPELWLHPLGPLLKNLPIAAILWFLIQATPAASPVTATTA